MHITVRSGGVTVHLCGFGARRDYLGWPGAGTPVVTWVDDFDAMRAVHFVRRHFGAVDGMSRLRSLLVRDLHGVSRLTDAEVVNAVASRLAGRMWHAGFQTGTIPAVAQPVAPLVARPRASTSTRRSDAPRPAPRPAGRPAPAPASAGAPADWLDDADQVAQAETLERAARSGTPFCEVCARAAQQQQRAAEAVDG